MRLCRHRETPVVKAAGRELSLVLLSGILSCYAMTFLIVAARPSPLACASQQLGFGMSFSVCYSALLVKTNRISRIFRAGRRTVQRPGCISPSSQLVLCAAIAGVQLVLGLTWLAVSPPAAVHYHPTRDDNQLVCMSTIGSENSVAFVYPIVLIAVCTVHAVSWSAMSYDTTLMMCLLKKAPFAIIKDD
jgi:metabotropic X receptor